MKNSFRILAAVAAVWAITCIAMSCAESGRLDVNGINELMRKNSNDLTSADIDFFLNQVEILVDKTKDMSKEENTAYFESLDKEEQECAIALGMMVSMASPSGTDKPDEWSDAQIERLKSLKEQLK